ncbi:MAG: SAM-dependent methyltransferase [Anaerolineae bacterium]
MSTLGSIPFSSSPLALDLLACFQARPLLWERGTLPFWDDPYISRQMLAAHLDPGSDAASRRPETIDRSVAWIVDRLGLRGGDAVLDLGCGPGLYAARLAERGGRVTGVDYSRSSINYARAYAHEHELDITYRYQDYLNLTDSAQYDAALLIYGDFCPLAPEERTQLLQHVRRALKPGGRFVLDVSTPACRARHGLRNGWYVATDGFWRPGPHLVLEQGFAYTDQAIYLDQYIVIEANGRLAVYRNWFQDYTPETIVSELTQGGFAVESLWGDLAGMPYQEGSEWIGVVARPA